jgi:transposase
MTTSIERNGEFLIVTKEEPYRNIKTIFLKYIPVVHYDVDNLIERRLAVIELVERDICSNKIAAELCDFHRNTVINLLRTKRLLGIEAVCQDGRGRKEPLKFITELRLHIKTLICKYPDWSDQKIADRSALELKTEISRNTVNRIRNEKQNQKMKLPDKKELMDSAALAEQIVEEYSNKLQLWLNFDTEPELKAKAAEFSLAPLPSASNDSQQALIEALQKGKPCAFAGGFIHHLFLEEIGFDELMMDYDRVPGATYQGSDILASMFHSVTQGIQSIEALKLVNASEFGLLIGRSRSPAKETMRDCLGQMSQKYASGEIIERFAQRLLEQDRIDKEVFFIDGHFLPYYGMNIIAKGYFTVRRLAMRGNELYLITDLQGRPLFFITESNEIDFRPIISRSAEMLEHLGINRPIMVFDRGGYGVHFFSTLNEKADFVTWAKHLTEKSLTDIPDDKFRIGVYAGENHFLVAEETRIVSESVQTAKRDGRETPTRIELRLVVLKDVDTGKRLGIFTNNTSKPLYDIAWYMLQRWGKSENVFKELMATFNLNYHPGYDIKELEKQPLVDNPDIALTKHAIKALKNESVAIEKEILYTEAILSKDNRKKFLNELTKLQAKQEKNREDTIEFEQRLTTLPDKVSIVELLQGKQVSRCDLEKKKLYDLMQMMAYHSRERLIEIFRECYTDHRDIKKVLDMITTKAGIVKLVGQTLMVILRGIENRKHREAALKLCRKLNEIGVTMNGGMNLALSFHLADIP